jgi:hypothetical protein
MAAKDHLGSVEGASEVNAEAEDAIVTFIGNIAVHYPTPKHETPEAEAIWLKSMVSELRGSSPEVLDRAARHIIQTRKYRNFPLPSECREACRRAAGEIDALRHVETLPTLRKSLGDEWSTERCKLAYDLIKSGTGKQAAREGWILAMWHFCRKHQRAPMGPEIDACKREAAAFDEAYDMCLRGGPFANVLEKFGDAVVAKREKLIAEALGR